MVVVDTSKILNWIWIASIMMRQRRYIETVIWCRNCDILREIFQCICCWSKTINLHGYFYSKEYFPSFSYVDVENDEIKIYRSICFTVRFMISMTLCSARTLLIIQSWQRHSPRKYDISYLSLINHIIAKVALGVTEWILSSTLLRSSSLIYCNRTIR